MKKKSITLLLGTFILFIWNALSWMVLPFHSNALNSIPESAFEQETFKTELPKDGVYHYPAFPSNNSPESFANYEEKLEIGPRITFMVYKNGATGVFEVSTFIINFIFNFLTVALLLFLLSNQTSKSLVKILITTLALGLLVSFTSDLPQMNWFMFPISYTLPNIFDYLISFALVGLLFARYTFKTKTV